LAAESQEYKEDCHSYNYIDGSKDATRSHESPLK
jgi:hypothetical protein